MKSIIAVLALILAAAFAQNGVVVDLYQSTFKQFVNSNPVVMVEFYSPGCAHCKAFAPEYDSTAKLAKKKMKPYAFGRVDVNAEDSLATFFGVSQLPTIIVFALDKPQVYYQERQSEIILQYMDQLYKKSFQSAPVNTADELKAHTALTETMQAILVGDDEKALAEFKKVARKFDNVDFFHTSVAVGSKVFEGLPSTPAVVFLKDFDEKKAVYSGAMEEAKIDAFVSVSTRHVTTDFNQQTVAQVFKPSGKKGFVLFRAESAKAEVDAVFREFAAVHRAEDLIFIVTDVNDGLGKRVGKMLDLNAANLPHVEILETRERLQRTKFEGKITIEELTKFLKDWRDTRRSTTKSDL